MPEAGPTPTPESLQFQFAEPIAAEAAVETGPQCVLCKRRTGNTYYHAQGQVVCSSCADRIQAGQQAPPKLSLARAFLYGAGAAVGGSILYALVTIITGLSIGLMAIVVGIMVGKAIRHASGGLGGRGQQVLAVVLTYFAITTSYITVTIYHMVKNPELREKARAAAKKGSNTTSPGSISANSGSGTSATGNQFPAIAPRPSGAALAAGLMAALFMILLLAVAAPFLSLAHGTGFITLFIIFIGLQRAWKLTGRSEILVMGPYEVTPAHDVPSV